MFRKKRVWRKCVSDVIKCHQDRALDTSVFILREFGPVGFLLQEEGQSRHYKVCLGDPHTCTCAMFQKEKDLCKHICWILMRKFRLPRDHEYCFQSGLVERQILELLQGLHLTATTSHNDRHISEASCPEPDEEDGCVRQKDIQKDDICPICQEELLVKRLPVTFCRFSCGNNIHISCMKVWADHQMKLNSQIMLKCPLCRDDFNSYKHLNQEVRNAGCVCSYYERECLDKHLGVVCNACGVCPVMGTCFRCTECCFFHLCEKCFRRNAHPQHLFMCRMKRGQSWRTVCEETQEMSRSSVCDGVLDVVPNHIMKSLPMMRVRKESKLLHMGVQCRICLSRFMVGQTVRSLPCKHKFHTDCIDPLVQKSNCCPLDFHVIYNPLTWKTSVSQTQISPASPAGVHSKHTDPRISEFILPGIGLQVQKDEASSGLRSVRPGTHVKSLTQDIHRTQMKPISRQKVKKPAQVKTPSEGLSSAAAVSTFTCLNITSALNKNQQRPPQISHQRSHE